MKATLSPELIALWHRLCETNQRATKPAHRQLLRMWQRGEPAGMAWPQKSPSANHPIGCSYANLCRHTPQRPISTSEGAK